MKKLTVDFFFCIVVGLFCFLHVDFWAWNKIHPIFLGWIPYHIWYAGILTISWSLFALWFGAKLWPNPPEDLFKKGGE